MAEEIRSEVRSEAVVRADKQTRKVRKSLSFEIDDRIHIAIDVDLAVELGDLILDAQTDNTALIAMAMQLKNM